MKIKGDICFIGQKKAGKSSIIKVIFNKVQPFDTRHLDATLELEACEVDFKGFFKYQVLDFPGYYDVDSLKEIEKEILKECGAVIYVVDSTAGDSQDLAKHFKGFYTFLKESKSNATINVFLHKSDSENQQEASQDDFWQAFNNELKGSNEDDIDHNIELYSTSIYDHSIFEMMSKIVSKMTEKQVKGLKNMMADISSYCILDKVFLFDIFTKLYFSTDHVPTDPEVFSVCAEMLDIYMDFSAIYGKNQSEGMAITNGSTNTAESEQAEPEPFQVVIKLDDKKVYLLQQITELVVIVVSFSEDYLDKKGSLDYNLQVFRDSFKKLVSDKK